VDGIKRQGSKRRDRQDVLSSEISREVDDLIVEPRGIRSLWSLTPRCIERNGVPSMVTVE
jgi:hypothetical protein